LGGDGSNRLHWRKVSEGAIKLVSPPYHRVLIAYIGERYLKPHTTDSTKRSSVLIAYIGERYLK